MDETYGTYVHDECFDIHEYADNDHDTDHDTDDDAEDDTGDDTNDDIDDDTDDGGRGNRRPLPGGAVLFSSPPSPPPRPPRIHWGGDGGSAGMGRKLSS